MDGCGQAAAVELCTHRHAWPTCLRLGAGWSGCVAHTAARHLYTYGWLDAVPYACCARVVVWTCVVSYGAERLHCRARACTRASAILILFVYTSIGGTLMRSAL